MVLNVFWIVFKFYRCSLMYVVVRLGLFLITCLGLVNCVPSTSLLDHNGTPDSSVPGGQLPLTIETITSNVATPPERNDLSETITIIPTPPIPGATGTPKPTTTPSISPTPIPIPDVWSRVYYSGLYWSVPATWWPVTDALFDPMAEDHNLIYAVASDADAATLLAQPSPSFPNGLMWITFRSVVEMPPPEAAQAVTVSGHAAWLQQEGGQAMSPVTRRTTLFVVTESNSLSLACAPPSEADVAEQANYEDLCRRVWERMAADIEILDFPLSRECPDVPPLLPTDAITWRRIESRFYQYAFEIPAGWLENRGPTSDIVQFLSDPGVHQQPQWCPKPNGVMALDFTAGADPNRAGHMEITVSGRLAWIRRIQGEEPMPPSDIGWSVYIQGPEYWYHLSFLCSPPTDADVEGQKAYHAQCEAMLNQILERFQVLPS